MSRKKKAVAAGTSAYGAASTVKDNPKVKQIIGDEDLHDNVRVAFDSAQQAYTRLSNAKKPPKALLNDKKLHQDIEDAAQALRDVGVALTSGKPSKKKKSGGLFKKVLLLAILGGGALAASSDLRNKVLDLLFGAEEEFDYTSTTSPATPPPGA